MSRLQKEILSSFDLGDHGPAALKRAYAAAAVLVKFATEDGRIPEERIQEAARKASLATGRYWSSGRCRNLANMMRLTPTDRS